MREHKLPHEYIDCSPWVADAADEACGERIRIRLEYLRWLHRAVAWEHTKERAPKIALATALLVVPGFWIGYIVYRGLTYKRSR